MNVKKIIFIILGFIFFVIFALGLFSYMLMQRSLPQTEGTIHLQGIRSEIEIIYESTHNRN